MEQSEFPKVSAAERMAMKAAASTPPALGAEETLVLRELIQERRQQKVAAEKEAAEKKAAERDAANEWFREAYRDTESARTESVADTKSDAQREANSALAGMMGFSSPPPSVSRLEELEEKGFLQFTDEDWDDYVTELQKKDKKDV